MKKIILLLAAAAVICSCNPYKNDPVAQAIEKTTLSNYPDQPHRFRFQKLEKIDSTVFRTEVDRRIGTFEAKIRKNKELYHKYVRTGFTVNADIKKQTLMNDSVILIKLHALKEEMGPKLDEVAYYDYKFTAFGKVGDIPFDLIDYYATVTPDNECLTVSEDVNAIHRATGKVLPGYMEIVKTIAVEGEETEE